MTRVSVANHRAVGDRGDDGSKASRLIEGHRRGEGPLEALEADGW